MFCMSRVWDKTPDGSNLIFGDSRISLWHNIRWLEEVSMSCINSHMVQCSVAILQAYRRQFTQHRRFLDVYYSYKYEAWLFRVFLHFYK